MKMKVTIDEKQLIELVQTAIKNRFPHESIIFSKMSVLSVPADRDGPAYFKGAEIEIEFD